MSPTGRAVFAFIAIGFLASSSGGEPELNYTPAFANREPAAAKKKTKISFENSTRETASTNANNAGYIVIQVDPMQPVHAFKDSGYKVISSEEFYATNPWTEPSPRLRDKIFRASGLNNETAQWDHLDRDILFLAAQEMTDDELVQQYPRLPKTKLGEMKKIIRREKGGVQ
jgi:hypothetical protein